MILNHVRLKLPTQVISTAVTTGDRLFIGQSLNPELLQEVYAEKIIDPGATEERAVYLAAHSTPTLPSIPDLLLRHLRA